MTEQQKTEQTAVTECAVHTRETDFDCDVCKAAINELEAIHKRKAAENGSKLQALARAGINVDPGGMVSIRTGMIVQMLLGEGTKQRLTFECDFQDNLLKNLEKIQSQARQAQLLQGVQPGTNGKQYRQPPRR